ncbi:DNA damage tolerance protein rad31 [Trichodelitschia bisporula]|uniref:Ubiquitin-like 1-activating enzyme E1A n=1 Tax=Trichodelitschia bisporula TaxID=703511 RepID=A0A6G1I8T8_9PEZI|nr:DNA damage tolerance protein rad31 [Trichodelitschia bisporula]
MTNNNGAATPTTDGGPVQEHISADEIALYDRQIRLWGVQAQENIRKANILLISFKALANEVAKNLVLAGIGSLTVADHEVVTAEDLAAQFCVSGDDVGKNRAEAAVPYLQELNPRVKISVSTVPISDQLDKDPTGAFLAPYDVVIATSLPYLVLKALNTATRKQNKPFYAAAVHGYMGFIFADLISHTFVIERKKGNVPTVLAPETPTRDIVAATTKRENGQVKEFVTKRERYVPLDVAVTAPLPAFVKASSRRVRQVPSLLPMLRALFAFEVECGRVPARRIFDDSEHEDVVNYRRLVNREIAVLGLNLDAVHNGVDAGMLLDCLDAELAPVTAILGGQLAQDIINVLSKREQPIQNLLLFDGDTYSAPIYPMHPEQPALKPTESVVLDLDD